MSKLIYELKKFGFVYVFIHILYELKLCKYSTFYKHIAMYYKNVNKSDYESELQEWFDIYGNKDSVSHPVTFGGKIQWLKINDNIPIKAQLSDKYEVREWIKEKIGDKYLIPILGVWDSVDEIDYNKLPDRFVLKANHGSGMNIIVRDKSEINVKKFNNIMSAWMDENFGWVGLELQYTNIKKKIIAEEYIEQMDGNLLDYKIHCFHGVPRIIQVIGNRNLETHTAREAIYDTEWKRNDLMCYPTYNSYENEIRKPDNIDEMLEIARILSKGFKYVRVDLYEIENHIKFGEMTFTPANGIGKWDNEDCEKLVGSWI